MVFLKYFNIFLGWFNYDIYNVFQGKDFLFTSLNILSFPTWTD